MAPDRGSGHDNVAQNSRTEQYDDSGGTPNVQHQSRSQRELLLAERASRGQNFTLRGIMVGLGVGTIICFSNMYFGLQTGWVSTMSMPASLIGFAFFKTLSRHLDLPFTEVENVLIQTVAGSMGTMPLGCGFVGVIPALNYMLKPEEQGPIILSLWQLILWALGLCYFGVVFAVPLRRQFIIREKLKFPTGTATALMIGVLHGSKDLSHLRDPAVRPQELDDDVEPPAVHTVSLSSNSQQDVVSTVGYDMESSETVQLRGSWEAKIRLLVMSFTISGLLTLCSYFFPTIRNLPIFGIWLAQSWLWTLNPSLAYVGQGIIMGPATTLHMLLGAVIGWALLSPLSKSKGWAPGPVDDWESGSRGWIVWISLAIMLTDSVVNLGFITYRSVVAGGLPYIQNVRINLRNDGWKGLLLQAGNVRKSGGYERVDLGGQSPPLETSTSAIDDHESFITTLSQDSPDAELEDLPDTDAPSEHLVGNLVVWVGLFVSVSFCIICIRITFGSFVPLYATIVAVFIALILSIMGVRALGETDLNPVSGISKLAQLFFAFIIPQSNKNVVIINLVAGAVSEAGALQAGDLLQDLKTGHLVGAAPNAQFWGQIVGSTVGAVVSAMIYKLYTRVYTVPGDLFQVPTGYVWIFTARLVTGQGLPDMAWQWALGAAVLFTITTGCRIAGARKSWHPYIPGGIAVAVGMYNVPSFTLARALGGIVNWYWRSYRKREETPIVILASGLILGEGVMSIMNLLLASFQVPHI